MANPDYIDQDVAYLLGLILARGEFHQEGDIRRILVRSPYRLVAVPGGATTGPDRETAIRLGLGAVRNRIEELLETNVRVERGEHVVTLIAVFTRNTIGWRDLRYLTGNRCRYTEFELPGFAYRLERETQVELMRGFADASSEPSPADNDQAGRHRVVLQVQFGNRRLPIQICRLLQTRLDVPVSNILWGHPNLRAREGGHGWRKETRIRIYAEDFEPVGYYFKYKQDVFQQLVRANRGKPPGGGRPCNPKAKRIARGSLKPPHADEDDDRLPEGIRGCHFDGYFQVCKKIGCRQGQKPPRHEVLEDGQGG